MVTYARTKLIKGKIHVFITRNEKMGGDSMKEKTETKDSLESLKREEMVFVNANEIPSKMGKRAEITNKLLELFVKIPTGKAWKINVNDSIYKFGTVKMAIAKINSGIKDVEMHYRCTQRKIGEDVFVYVVRGETEQ